MTDDYTPKNIFLTGGAGTMRNAENNSIPIIGARSSSPSLTIFIDIDIITLIRNFAFGIK
jgi:hypothetical protein